MNNNDKKPLFTLTAEEVEVAEVVFNSFIMSMPDLRKFIIEHNKEFRIINGIIERIKQWQKEKIVQAPTNGTRPNG